MIWVKIQLCLCWLPPPSPDLSDDFLMMVDVYQEFAAVREGHGSELLNPPVISNYEQRKTRGVVWTGNDKFRCTLVLEKVPSEGS